MRRLTIHDMKELAKKHNGKCLSISYINMHTKLMWKCKLNHIWKADPSNIKSNHWCPYCAGNAKYTLKHIRTIAKNNNIECLSKKYKNNRTKLKWKCKKNHIWKTTLNNILQGRGCPKCSGCIKTSIRDIKQFVKKYNGECLSTKYKNQYMQLKWKCQCGHVWYNSFSNIKKGSWCPKCYQGISESKCFYILCHLINKTWELKNNKILNNRQHIDFYCQSMKIAVEYQDESHYHVVYNKKALQEAQRRDKIKYKIIQKLLHENKINYYFEIPYWEAKNDDNLILFCKNKLNEYKINKFNKINIEDFYKNHSPYKDKILELKNIAKARHGHCLSDHYVDARTKLKWKCHSGHEWEASSFHIKQGTWCPVCSGNTPKNILDAIKIAKTKNGECLSKKYKNNHTKLKWKCQQGHIWKSALKSIQKGSWCPKCAIINRKINIYLQ